MKMEIQAETPTQDLMVDALKTLPVRNPDMFDLTFIADGITPVAHTAMVYSWELGRFVQGKMYDPFRSGDLSREEHLDTMGALIMRGRIHQMIFSSDPMGNDEGDTRVFEEMVKVYLPRLLESGYQILQANIGLNGPTYSLEGDPVVEAYNISMKRREGIYHTLLTLGGSGRVVYNDPSLRLHERQEELITWFNNLAKAHHVPALVRDPQYPGSLQYQLIP